MKFEFGSQSKLFGRTIHSPFDRFAYVPRSAEGKVEYIFAYREAIPNPVQEPELYRDALLCNQEPDQVELQYNGLDEIVLLLTIEADNAFRDAHPEIVAQNELFKLEL